MFDFLKYSILSRLVGKLYGALLSPCWGFLVEVPLKLLPVFTFQGFTMSLRGFCYICTASSHHRLFFQPGTPRGPGL
jgi:hypothetical protein